jgi:Ca2+/H+ antiporter, TMEM165/GDT1 family
LIGELIRACFFILMAEMGDKTQILALAFATKYKVQKVLLGVFIGSLLNHGLAVILGTYLSSVIPLGTIRLVAACSFICFGLWSLKAEKGEEEEDSKERFGPVFTVAAAFFIGELGDKTQLTAITLSTNSPYPVFILMGTVLGMIVTSAIGIFVGSRLGKKIPEFTMKLVSSSIFIFFGVVGLYEAVPGAYITAPYVAVFTIGLAAAVYLLLIPSIRLERQRRITPLKRVANKLHESIGNISPSIESLCHGVQSCGSCKSSECSVACAKSLLKNSSPSRNYVVSSRWQEDLTRNKRKFDRMKTQKALQTVVDNCLRCGKEHEENCVVNRVREILEMEYYGEKKQFDGNIDEYLFLIKQSEEELDEGRIVG